MHFLIFIIRALVCSEPYLNTVKILTGNIEKSENMKLTFCHAVIIFFLLKVIN